MGHYATAQQDHNVPDPSISVPLLLSQDGRNLPGYLGTERFPILPLSVLHSLCLGPFHLRLSLFPIESAPVEDPANVPLAQDAILGPEKEVYAKP